MSGQGGGAMEVFDRGKAREALARRDNRLRVRLGHSFDLPEAEAEGRVLSPRPRYCAIPFTLIHIHRANFHAMLFGVADDLGRGVKTHRLAVEKSGGES